MSSGLPKVKEGKFSLKEIQQLNVQGYNIYTLPNYPKDYDSSTTIDGTHIDCFNWVFVDCDLKDGKYGSKEEFIEAIGMSGIAPARVVDSGNGVHVYWRILDLDAKSYLRFQRRLTRLFNTDEAVGQIFQLMRLPGTLNTKKGLPGTPCEILFENDQVYTSEQFDKLLPTITREDEAYCVQHYNRTYKLDQTDIQITEEMPAKWGKLLLVNSEVKGLFVDSTSDRSKNDFRLGNVLKANGFSKEEAMTVLMNSAKASQRSPIHRVSYAQNIVNKIWTDEVDTDTLDLSSSVKDISNRSNNNLEGTRLRCWKYLDDTQAGFQLGHVLGLVAGSGVGKTAMALNIFMGFVTSNHDYDHFFVSLEQTDKEIAARWQAMCGDNTSLHDRVQVIMNYGPNGEFRDLSLSDIRKYILKYQKVTSRKVGCVVIDHIGVLCNTNKLGQDEGVKQIAKEMKSFAIETQTFLVMQSQTSREKAGIGDLELDKDAAFGTSVFENFCDYLVTLWQPFKRSYSAGAPTVMAYKFCKIRHKKQGVDKIVEDTPYMVLFDPKTELIRTLTQEEDSNLGFWVSQSTNKRKLDKKTGLVTYTSIKWKDEKNAT